MSELSPSSGGPVEFIELVERFKKLSEPDRRIAVYEYVRDIAYGDIGSRNPFDVLAAHKGTCSGKHALLKLLLETLGYDVQSWFASHDFGRFPITNWPPELAEFHGKAIPDYHDFLKIRIGDQWVIVDAVFDAPLATLGFPLLEWDGETDMQLPVQTSGIFPAEGDMEEHKKRLIAMLPEEIQTQRKAFLSALTKWLDAKRK